MSKNTMPCRNTAALKRYESAIDAAERHQQAEQEQRELRVLYDEEIINEMVWDQAGESEQDEELALLLLAAGVDAMTKGTALDQDRIVELITSREWFQRAVDELDGV